MCGNPLGFRAPAESYPKVQLDPYLASVSAVLKNGRAMHHCVYNVEDGEFEKDGYRHRSAVDRFGELNHDNGDPDQALLVHGDCHRFVKTSLNTNITLRCLPIRNARLAVDYGDTAIYAFHPFELDRVLSKDDAWILSGPLKMGAKYARNRARLQAILAQFVSTNFDSDAHSL